MSRSSLESSLQSLCLQRRFIHQRGKDAPSTPLKNIERLLHNKIICVHEYGLFFMSRCNNNIPRFPLSACLALLLAVALLRSRRLIPDIQHARYHRGIGGTSTQTHPLVSRLLHTTPTGAKEAQKYNGSPVFCFKTRLHTLGEFGCMAVPHVVSLFDLVVRSQQNR